MLGDFLVQEWNPNMSDPALKGEAFKEKCSHMLNSKHFFNGKGSKCYFRDKFSGRTSTPNLSASFLSF